jgi:Cysteine rich repeat
MVRLGLAFALIVAGSMSFAQPSMFQGTPQEQQACKSDVMKHCKALLTTNAPNTFDILSCLQRNRKRLSKACQSVLNGHGQ